MSDEINLTEIEHAEFLNNVFQVINMCLKYDTHRRIHHTTVTCLMRQISRDNPGVCMGLWSYDNLTLGILVTRNSAHQVNQEVK